MIEIPKLSPQQQHKSDKVGEYHTKFLKLVAEGIEQLAIKEDMKYFDAVAIIMSGLSLVCGDMVYATCKTAGDEEKGRPEAFREDIVKGTELLAKSAASWALMRARDPEERAKFEESVEAFKRQGMN
jgi:hypothetical protein